jgi:hypothetical protein
MVMPQAIEVKGQSQQQGLANLQGQAAAGRFRRELAFDHREDGFYFCPRPIQLPGKRAVHMIADFCFRNAAPRVSGNHAVGSQHRANVSAIRVGVELGIRQHHADGQGQDAAGRIHQAGQRRGAGLVWPAAPG